MDTCLPVLWWEPHWEAVQEVINCIVTQKLMMAADLPNFASPTTLEIWRRAYPPACSTSTCAAVTHSSSRCWDTFKEFHGDSLSHTIVGVQRLQKTSCSPPQVEHRLSVWGEMQGDRPQPSTCTSRLAALSRLVLESRACWRSVRSLMVQVGRMGTGNLKEDKELTATKRPRWCMVKWMFSHVAGKWIQT